MQTCARKIWEMYAWYRDHGGSEGCELGWGRCRMEINGPAVEALAEPMEFWSYCSFIDCSLGDRSWVFVMPH